MPAIIITLMAAGLAMQVTGEVIKAVPGPKEKQRIKDFEKLQKATERRFKQGDFGFDAAEQEQLSNIGLASVQGAEREYYSRQNELAALQGMGGGAMIQQDLARQEAAVRARADVSQTVRKLELQQREKEMADANAKLAADEAIVLKEEAARRGAVVEGFTDVGEAAMDFGTFAYMMEMKYGGTTPAATGVDATSPIDFSGIGLETPQSYPTEMHNMTFPDGTTGYVEPGTLSTYAPGAFEQVEL